MRRSKNYIKYMRIFMDYIYADRNNRGTSVMAYKLTSNSIVCSTTLRHAENTRNVEINSL